MTTEADVLRALAGVKDPELGKDVVSLHMIEGVKVEGSRVTFTLNLTTPACPLRSRLEESAREAVASLPGVKKVEMKTSSMVFATRDYANAEMLKGVKNIIAVASGKGGVGKSTIAVNLAVALAASGAKVGVLDADVYGPNIPLMMGVKGPPDVRNESIIPPEAFGVKIASLGFFYNEETPVIWRGPLVAGAVRQLLTQVDWGELDYLVCDLPPGCLPAGTSVLMADNSPRPIEKIEVGEFVLSYDGERLVPRRVLGVIPQGTQEVFRLRTANREIVASANHPFLRYHRANSWVRLDHLKIGDRIIVPNCIEGGQPMRLPKVESDPEFIQLPTETTADFMRIVGHFVGDGFVKRQKGRPRPVGVRVCEPRGSRFRKQYEELYKKVFKCRTFDENGGQKFAVASVPLAELFTALDLDHKARQKTVPRWVFSLPLDQRLAFIRGYSEADSDIRHRESTKALPDSRGLQGMVTVVQDTVTVESPNSMLVDKVHELCLISGVRASLVKSRFREEQTLPEGRRKTNVTSHWFQFSLKHDPRAFKLSRIQSIEPLGAMETYDLQVDQLENFVADSILVHNTGDAALTLAQTVPLGGVLIVTTPQDAALNIAAKALAMFRQLNVPILGVVENMSYFVCPHCGERTDIFSNGGGKRIAAERGVDFLGEIPIGVSVREQSDKGVPVVAAKPDSPESQVYKDLAFRLAGMVSMVAFSKMKK
ncbi:MAG: P-loop NTPase [Nitrososphaerota archaeon]|nr:P-loop NTPase [Nitrososphaerota archaeon]MDG7023337.1 P-loop NTPase [Nitrososphaerota archaeon]